MQMAAIAKTAGKLRLGLSVLAALALAGGASAQTAGQTVTTVDPNVAINADLGTPSAANAPGADYATPVGSEAGTTPALPAEGAAPTSPVAGPAAVPESAQQGTTYRKDDLIGAAEGVFGKGAKGLAGMIEDVLRKQGEPNGYIVGREAGGAFVVGLRYGSGTLYHKVEGQKPVYWTGPSVGFDAGANAGNTFVLVYNLYDTEDLYKRFPAGEGAAYALGGFNASYLRQGDVVLIPVRLGVGLRLGVNAGYMKFTHKQKWLPF